MLNAKQMLAFAQFEESVRLSAPKAHCKCSQA